LKRNKIQKCGFYLVTDSGLSRRGTFSDVEQAVRAGYGIIQYREKHKNTREMIIEAGKLKDICGERAVFLVNDRVDVTLAVDADGVHIGQDDMPFEKARELLGCGKIIGVTVHDVEEAIEAEKAGADYIGVSPVFETGTKKDAGKACGLSMVKEVRKRVKLPIVAIGGITRENVSSVIRAGADIAVAISAVICSDDVQKMTEDFIAVIQRTKKE